MKFLISYFSIKKLNCVSLTKLSNVIFNIYEIDAFLSNNKWIIQQKHMLSLYTIFKLVLHYNVIGWIQFYK